MGDTNTGADKSQIANLRVSEISAQFPDTLGEDQVELLTRRVERVLGAIDELRSYPLTNGDEPAPVFRPVSKEQP